MSSVGLPVAGFSEALLERNVGSWFWTMPLREPVPYDPLQSAPETA